MAWGGSDGSVCMASSVHQALALFHGQLIYSFRVLFCEIKEKAIIYAGNLLKKQTRGWSLFLAYTFMSVGFF